MTTVSLPKRRVAAAGLFVVGRFRSGTTVIWNILRHIPGVRAYYEPCHDSLLEHLRLTTSPDPTHVRVSDYWKEYTPILATLPHYYRKEFGTERLCLSERAEHAELKAYLDFLLAGGAPDEIACLKLNRMDLRLPWLRTTFPDTPVVYIYRDPRDQWVSIFRGEHGAAMDDPYLNSGYDLMIWSANLFPYVPRLGSSAISSSYERHYLIWRISLELAKVYADCIINFEQEFQDEPERGLVKLLHMLGRDNDAQTGLRDLIVSTKRNTWEACHEARWFADIEQRCDRYLEEAGILRQIGEKTVFSNISDAVSWNAGDTLAGLVFPLCRVVSRCRSIALENAGRLTSSLEHAHVYIKQLEDEVHKISRDSQASVLERDRELERRSEAYTQLAGSLDKTKRDAADEIARRDHAAAEKDAYISSLEKEIAKCQRAAALEIHTRDEMLEQKDHYIRSLEQKVRELQDNSRAR